MSNTEYEIQNVVWNVYVLTYIACYVLRAAYTFHTTSNNLQVTHHIGDANVPAYSQQAERTRCHSYQDLLSNIAFWIFPWKRWKLSPLPRCIEFQTELNGMSRGVSTFRSRLSYNFHRWKRFFIVFNFFDGWRCKRRRRRRPSGCFCQTQKTNKHTACHTANNGNGDISQHAETTRGRTHQICTLN